MIQSVLITCHLLQPFQILKCAFWHNIERCIYLFNVFIYFMLLNFKRNNGRLFVMLTLVYNPLITRFNIRSVIEFQKHIFFQKVNKSIFYKFVPCHWLRIHVLLFNIVDKNISCYLIDWFLNRFVFQILGLNDLNRITLFLNSMNLDSYCSNIP